MSFEKTQIFYNLVESFCRHGEELKNTTDKEKRGREFAERFARMHGQDKIKKVCAKANQKLKQKIFSI